METLKKYFPISFKYTADVANLIIGILIYIVIGIVAGVIISVCNAIPILWIVTGIVGTLIDIYCVAGVVIQILVFAKVLKE